MKRSSKIRFYRKVRAALLATNKRTDNSIITECNIVMPLANAKGVSMQMTQSKARKRVKVKKVTNKRTIFDK